MKECLSCGNLFVTWDSQLTECTKCRKAVFAQSHLLKHE